MSEGGWQGGGGCRRLKLVVVSMWVGEWYTRTFTRLAGEEAEVGTPSRSHATHKAPEMKNFSFYTVVDLGPIMYREEPKLTAEL